MATVTESAQRTHLALDRPEDSMGARTVPILTPTIKTSAPSPSEPMEITTPTNSSAPASATKSPDSETNGILHDRPHPTAGLSDMSLDDNIIMPAPVAAAAAVHQPKIVQTAFIHKLYKYETNPSFPSWSLRSVAVGGQGRKLTQRQHARGQVDTAPDLVDSLGGEFRHATFARVLKSTCVCSALLLGRTAASFGSGFRLVSAAANRGFFANQYLVCPANTSNTPTSRPSYGS